MSDIEITEKGVFFKGEELEIGTVLKDTKMLPMFRGKARVVGDKKPDAELVISDDRLSEFEAAFDKLTKEDFKQDGAPKVASINGNIAEGVDNFSGAEVDAIMASRD